MCHPIPSGSQTQTPCAAKLLDPFQRQQLAIQGLAGTQSVSVLAKDNDVSRKFVYQQTAKAQEALNDAFTPNQADDEVLFHLPVTKNWLRQLTLGLVFICHSSLRGVTELTRDLFDCPVSTTNVHNILEQAVPQARAYVNRREYLANVRIGAHDEIFQANRPVLAGIDVESTFCYLLSQEEQRDGDTWALRLLELTDYGFDPEAIVSDAGSGLCKGQELALPDVPHRGDVFHALKDVYELAGFLENRVYQAITICDKLERKQAHNERRRGRKDLKLAKQLQHARVAEAKAIALADDVALLARWFRDDIFTLAGPVYADRCHLYDFLVAELRERQALCPQRIATLCTMLTNQRDALLAFAEQLDRDLNGLAAEFHVDPTLLRQILHVQEMPLMSSTRWQQYSRLQEQLGSRFYHLSEAVAEVARLTVRASSVVENFNSRLRCYFFLRRHLGTDYLVLLQFFLNHRRFLRSERPERVNKSPAELLTGESHPHWLEMLGYELFSRN